MRTEIIVDRRKLLIALSIGGNFAGMSKSLGVLDYVLFEVTGGKMRVTSMNSENMIEDGRWNVERGDDCRFLVNGSDVRKFISMVDDDTLRLVVEENYIELFHALGSTVFPIAPAEDFPAKDIPDGDCTRLVMNARTLFNYLAVGSSFVYSDDTAHPVLTCVQLYCKNGKAGAFSTDLKSLYYEEKDSDGEPYMIPMGKNIIKALLAVIGNKCPDDLDVEIYAYPTKTVIKCDGITMRANNVAGKTPDHHAIIPKDTPVSFTLSRNELLGSAKRGNIHVSSVITMTFDSLNSLLNIDAESLDKGRKFHEDIIITDNCEGGLIKVGVNAAKLASILENLNGEKVTFKAKDAMRALLIYSEAQPERKFLLMPIRVR